MDYYQHCRYEARSGKPCLDLSCRNSKWIQHSTIRPKACRWKERCWASRCPYLHPFAKRSVWILLYKTREEVNELQKQYKEVKQEMEALSHYQTLMCQDR